ncbi:MAG: CRISPR-associated helicase Cas3' [Ktedonobacteraceae bacterium]|nr:CRISPR-associated helicase Cas3' [Ktedonobacteraceae bacterium]
MSQKQNYEPRPFQRKMLKILQEEKKSVILQAPTGSGKTDAALLPYIQCLAQDEDWLPRTCLYATPMRVLSNQFYEKFRERIKSVDQKKGRRLTEIYYDKLKREPVSLQTGEQPHDPQLEALLTFCTIDQLLASFLAVPYGVDGGRLNLNVGAVVGSYLVLDEFHLYPLLKEGVDILGARTTALTMLRMLNSVTRFVLMTATFSTTLVDELATLLDAVVVKVDDPEELQQIASGRKRTFEVASVEMSAETILAQHQHCSLVICNTVLRAQQRYWELKQRAEQAGIEVILLHSRLTEADRTQRSNTIMHELGQAPETWDGEERYGWKDGHYYGKNLIVVATQVVEVGLDISVETLHTEIAHANSLIQRAGRCARFAQQEGRVIVYELPEQDAEGRPVTMLPYRKELCEKTLAALHKLSPQQEIGFKEEQALIDEVHTEEDKKLLANYNKQNVIKKRIFESFCTNERSIVTSLIRDVSQVQILIHTNPNDEIKEEPWRWQSFALHPASLASRWQILEERVANLPDVEWVGRQAVLIPESEEREVDSRRKAQYRWDPIVTTGNTDALTKTLAQTLMIVLHPKLATYHEELGFVLLDERLLIESIGYESTPPEDGERKKPKWNAIKVESYQQHIGGLMKAYSYDAGGIRANMRYVTTRLEKLMDFPTGAIDHAIRLAIACHDLGKLSESWQQWAHTWEHLLVQEGIDTSSIPSGPFFFAKTDFDYSREQWKLQNSMKQKRPNHACESVMFGINVIADSLGVDGPESKLAPLFYATCAAIARHHTPQAHECGDAVLAPGAIDAIRGVFEMVKRNAPWHYDLSCLETKTEHTKLDDMVTTPTRGGLKELETWLYFVIVRALRLADQRAGIRW